MRNIIKTITYGFYLDIDTNMYYIILVSVDREVNMSLKHGLLGFLSEHEMSGYDLEKLFSSSVGYFWSAKISQVYRDLHTMEKTGWVQSDDFIQTGRPNKKIYRITEAGKKELEKWLIDYDVKKDSENRIGILMRMFFAARRPKKETIAILQKHRINCQKALEQLFSIDLKLEQCDIEQPELFYSKATLSYGEKYYQMQIEWCTETIKKLEELQ